MQNIKFAEPIYYVFNSRYEVVIPIRSVNENNTLCYSLTQYNPIVINNKQLFESETNAIQYLKSQNIEVKDIIELPHTD